MCCIKTAYRTGTARATGLSGITYFDESAATHVSDPGLKGLVGTFGPQQVAFTFA
jgi:hypothetical protein